jgi:hypothetical protein
MPTDESRPPRARPVKRRADRGEPVIEDYFVVQANDPLDLRRAVLALIDVGWEPTGGVALYPVDVSLLERGWLYCQAMILRKQAMPARPAP